MKNDNYSSSKSDVNILEKKQHNLLGYSWYGNELIANRQSRYSTEEQMKVLETHPFFTGLCPECGHKLDKDNCSADYDCFFCVFACK